MAEPISATTLAEFLGISPGRIRQQTKDSILGGLCEHARKLAFGRSSEAAIGGG